MKELSLTMKMRGRPITPAEAQAAVQRLINSHFDQDPRALSQIPVNPADDDVVASDYVRQSELEIEALKVVLATPAAPLAEAICTFLDTPAAVDICGRICFQLSDIAHLMRHDGVEIERQAEAEQSHVMRWMLKLAVIYGESWVIPAEKALKEMSARLKAKKAAEAANG